MMEKKLLIICLTDNTWLHLGVSALLIRRQVINLTYGDIDSCTSILKKADSCILIIDMSIFLHGEWGVFDCVLAQRPDAKVIWLRRPDSGRIFPAGREGDYVIEQKQNFQRFSRELGDVAFCRRPKQRDNHVVSVVLTRQEKKLLPYLIHEQDIKKISSCLGIATKTLYNHRSEIQRKTGFSRINMMQLVYKKNLHLL